MGGKGFFFTYEYSTVSVTFIEKTIISSLNYHGAKSQLATHVVVSFWTLFCAVDLYIDTPLSLLLQGHSNT